MRPGLIIFSTLPMLSGVALAAAPAADGEDHGNSGGLPQLEFDTYPSQVFWLVITFLILYFLCAKVFLPRLGGIIEERRNRIADDFDQAAEFKRQAEEAEEAYKKSLADAKARAAQIAAETRAQIDAEIAELQAETDKELEAELSAAEERIANTTKAANAAVLEAARETTKALVAALIDETPSDDAIDTALNHAA
ncbi:F0F1 ATP synthase subunit B family protein [Parvularcula marina]|uniref:ATP synthase subunit b n=1 Tax=Parvularcula marina TaxID=2292771 RepID=A0A371RHI3_9PROT|nr:F0F1 ATP synthase subunit B' [Parvularcula marina]RFB04885.1 F0F1 ATP synthase subunit B' [Parvularcula marina]